jgi:uncharacterized protein
MRSCATRSAAPDRGARNGRPARLESVAGVHSEAVLDPHALEPVSGHVRASLLAAIEGWIACMSDTLVSLVLFGSQARGEAGLDSDVDLLIVATDLPRSLAERRRPFLASWDEVRTRTELPAVEWNLVVKSRDEARHHSPLYLDIAVDGIVLHDVDGFFSGVLDEIRARMRELGSRRVRLADGSWYWDLKPDYRFGDIVRL